MCISVPASSPFLFGVCCKQRIKGCGRLLKSQALCSALDQNNSKGVSIHPGLLKMHHPQSLSEYVGEADQKRLSYFRITYSLLFTARNQISALSPPAPNTTEAQD